ncbi:hypothetical protein ACS78_08080 [Priestia megaterium]|uniref:phage antirepressor KilAC domain-containing protein n=1 Tax=Priestia megaterium TaxID=1404 RepID=UPI0006A49C66|nr:phage antirepressor KilAC domain-containing protein [Priestia megaterium]KNH23901.1 hypothetical protein ACS78_08080 [Priestia megaterium]
MENLRVVADQMLPIYETSTGERVVDARELHENLMVSTRFNDWINRYIENYGFIESEDFYSFLSKTKGRPSQEFLLTLDTAKEISMVQNNEMGRTVRKYFIQVEKQFKHIQDPSYMIDDPIQRARKWIEEQKEKQYLLVQNQQKDQKIEELQPKATYYDLILQTKSLLSVSQIAKDYGMSAISFNKLLHKLGIQYKQGDCWLLYQKYADKGYTHTKTHVVDSEKSKVHTYWTQKGRTFIYETLKDENILPVIERMAS